MQYPDQQLIKFFLLGLTSANCEGGRIEEYSIKVEQFPLASTENLYETILLFLQSSTFQTINKTK